MRSLENQHIQLFLFATRQRQAGHFFLSGQKTGTLKNRVNAGSRPDIFTTPLPDICPFDVRRVLRSLENRVNAGSRPDMSGQCPALVRPIFSPGHPRRVSGRKGQRVKNQFDGCFSEFTKALCGAVPANLLRAAVSLARRLRPAIGALARWPMLCASAIAVRARWSRQVLQGALWMVEMRPYPRRAILRLVVAFVRRVARAAIGGEGNPSPLLSMSVAALSKSSVGMQIRGSNGMQILRGVLKRLFYQCFTPVYALVHQSGPAIFN